MLDARFSSVVLIALLASSPGAQQGRKIARYTGQLRPVTLDLETGTITRGASSTPKALATVSDFPNLDLNGFVGVDTGGGACEWIGHGVKGKNRNASDFVTGFSFAYCSSAKDPAVGGVGGATTISFREGYRVGGASPGTEVGRFTITGLPATTSCSGFFGGFRCYFANVDLGNVPLCFADGAIGYGWKFEDLGTCGLLAGTFPFLACVTSCSGPGPDGLGQVDFIDQYCPPGNLLSSFTFGTAATGGRTITSMSMDLREAKSTSHATTRYDPDNNPVVLRELSPPMLGASWRASINCTGQPLGGPGLIRVTTQGKLATPIVLAQGSLYISGRTHDFLFAHTGNVVGLLPVTIPKDLSFACLPFQVQGFCGQTGGGGRLSNALCSTVDVP